MDATAAVVEAVQEALGCSESISGRCLKHWAIGSQGWPCSVAVTAANTVLGGFTWQVESYPIPDSSRRRLVGPWEPIPDNG